MSGPALSNGSALELEGVAFSYPARSNGINGALYKDFSLRIEPGSIVTIMGASGSGKSTLGRIMAGIVMPQKGIVRRSPDFARPSDLVYVDQHPMNSVFPWQTVVENVRYPLQKLRWEGRERRDRICYLMNLFRLSALSDVYPAQLSGGELQRLALARCLSWKPKLVILDEPFSALDGKVKAEITFALHELALTDRMTLVLITHNVSDALALGMRCVIIARRPVRVMSDLDFQLGFPRQENTPDYDAMQQALINGIRDGLVVRRNWRGLSFVGGLLALWAVVAALRLVDPIILPAPWNVVRAVPGMLRERLWTDIALTLGRVLAALAVACVFGIPAGLFLGYHPRAYKVVEGPLHALRSIPASALFPLFLIVAGVGEKSMVALAAYPSLLVVLVNAVSGAALANQPRLYQARLLNLNSLETVSEVLFYEALPSIFDGIRTAVSYSLVLVVAVEMFIGLGERGLGRGIYLYQSSYRIPETYGGIIIAGAIGILLNWVVTKLQHHMLRWLPNVREEG